MNIAMLASFNFAENWVGLAVAAVLGVFFMQLLSYRFFQSYQLSSYRLKRYFTWLRKTPGKYPLRLLLTTLLGAVSLLAINALFYRFIGDIASYIGLGLMLVYAIIYLVSEYRSGRKTPLKETPRVLRMYIVYYLLVLGTVLGFTVVFPLGPFWLRGLCYTAMPVLAPVLALLSMLIMAPFEAMNNRRYIKKAEKKLAKHSCKVIGITGSYGKTSVKNMLYPMLRTKYNTVRTPDSYNTPLGVTRTVLQHLTEETEYFICEMGARESGDIRFLAKMTHPEIGVITGIAPQHLEYFKSMENLKNTKFELIEALAENGFAVFNGESTAELYERAKTEKYLTGRDIYADGVQTDGDGMRFAAVFGSRIIACKTKLLGRHNIENILTCILVCAKLGFTDEELSAAVEKIQSVPHRLELVKAENGIRIVDDTYNSNPVSAASAIDTVAEMEGRKVICTCGFIELGAVQDEEHGKLGEHIAKVFQKVILVGKIQTAKILEGLLRAGYAEEDVSVVPSLKEAQAMFATLLQPGDTLLLLNDLPDQYTESV